MRHNLDIGQPYTSRGVKLDFGSLQADAQQGEVSPDPKILQKID
jgi:hypothetical protein